MITRYSLLYFINFHTLILMYTFKSNLNHIFDLPPWPSGLAISGRGAVKAWLAIRQGMGSPVRITDGRGQRTYRRPAHGTLPEKPAG